MEALEQGDWEERICQYMYVHVHVHISLKVQKWFLKGILRLKG